MPELNEVEKLECRNPGDVAALALVLKEGLDFLLNEECSLLIAEMALEWVRQRETERSE